MPRYVVHVLRREIVVLGTDIEVSADSKKQLARKSKHFTNETKSTTAYGGRRIPGTPTIHLKSKASKRSKKPRERG
jgi:hypothetical protein